MRLWSHWVGAQEEADNGRNLEAKARYHKGVRHQIMNAKSWPNEITWDWESLVTHMCWNLQSDSSLSLLTSLLYLPSHISTRNTECPTLTAENLCCVHCYTNALQQIKTTTCFYLCVSRPHMNLFLEDNISQVAQLTAD